MNIALITAGGTGQRMQQDIPKQFLHIYDKPLLVYTLQAFQNHPDIDGIIVACLEGWEEILKAYAKQFNIDKLKWIVRGGDTGQASINNCLKKLKEVCQDDSVILIHDGNRALVSTEIISNAIVTCKLKGCAITAIDCVEAIMHTTDKISSSCNIPRENLVRTQTPHAFTLEKLLWLHNEAKNRNIDNSIATCSLMAEIGEKVYFSKGSEKNIKVTTVEDIELFKALLVSEKSEWLK